MSYSHDWRVPRVRKTFRQSILRAIYHMTFVWRSHECVPELVQSRNFKNCLGTAEETPLPEKILDSMTTYCRNLLACFDRSTRRRFLRSNISKLYRRWSDRISYERRCWAGAYLIGELEQFIEECNDIFCSSTAVKKFTRFVSKRRKAVRMSKSLWAKGPLADAVADKVKFKLN